MHVNVTVMMTLLDFDSHCALFSTTQSIRLSLPTTMSNSSEAGPSQAKPEYPQDLGMHAL